MSRALHLVFIAGVLWSLTFSSFSKPRRNQPTPSLSLDIRTLGFAPISDKDWKRLDKEFYKSYKVGDVSQLEADDPHIQLNFISNDILALSWTRGPNSEARWVREPLFLKAVFIDTKSGGIKFRQDWPMRVIHSGENEGKIFPVHRGQFIIRAYGQLQLYTADFQPSRKVDLATIGDGTWWLEVLPGGNQLFLISDQASHFSWLDVDTLQPPPAEAKMRESLHLVGSGIIPFEDGAYSIHDNCVRCILQTESPSICEPALCRNKSFSVRAQVLDEQRIALMCTNGVDLYTPDGKVVWSKPGSEPTGGFELTASLNGNRVAVESSGGKGSTFDGHQTPWGAHYFVYDSNSSELRFALSLPVDWEEADALSPDGSKFAVLNGNQLGIYEIPLRGTLPEK